MEAIAYDYDSEFFETSAKAMLIKCHEYLVAANDSIMLPMYRDTCRRLAYLAGQDATKAFAIARSYRLRGK